MSEYSLQYKNPSFSHEIKEDFDSLMSYKNIWIDNPISYKDRLGWLEISAIINKSIELCKDAFDKVSTEFNPSSVVFAGMGGSIQTGKVLNQISLDNKYQLLFIDSTNPNDINFAREKIDLLNTIFIFMSKSGTTLETNKIMSFFIKELALEGESNFGNRFIALTDTGTPLGKFAREKKFLKVLDTPANIGGRFSSSTPFGVFPATFMKGILTPLENNYFWDLDGIREKCLALTSILKNSYDNYDGILYLNIPEEINQMGIWLEQIIAETTGKNGNGIIPIINSESTIKYPNILINNESARKIKSHNVDELIIDLDKNTIFEDMFIWQASISILCKYMSVFPFDEPDVEKSKKNTENLLEKHEDIQNMAISYSDTDINNMISENKTNKVLYINLYLKETKKINDSLNKLKEKLYLSYGINTVTGFGPRYLHSIGQLQKGGSKDVWSIFFYDESLISHYIEKNNYKDLSDIFKAQMLGDFNALKELEINAYLVNIDSNKPNPFDEIMGSIKE